jgi:hypothetical protein
VTLLVVVELINPHAVAPHADEMVAACTASLRNGQCVLASDAPAARPADVLAHVTVEDALRFEIRVTRSAGQTTSSRVLEFREVDAPEERWRTVGITIASGTGDFGGYGPVDTPPPRPKAARRAQTDDERPFRVGGGMITGTGMEAGRVRLGGWLDGTYHFTRPLPYALVVGRYASAPAGIFSSDGGTVEVTSSWTSLGLGAGIAPGGVAGVGFRLQVAGLAERFDAAARDSSGENVSSDARWLPGWLVAGKALWPETGFIGAQVGGELSGVTGATGVELDGESVSQSPSFKWGLFFGLELRP